MELLNDFTQSWILCEPVTVSVCACIIVDKTRSNFGKKTGEQAK